MNDIISSSKIKNFKDRNTVSRTLPSKKVQVHVNMVPVCVIHAILSHVTLFMISLKQHVMKNDKKKNASIYETNSSRLACIYNNQQCGILLGFSRYHYHHNHGHRSKYSLFSSECFLQTTQ